MKQLLKALIRYWPWPLTINERYDRQTTAIIRKVCRHDSICIDVGCYKGDILAHMISSAPDARHIAFEPIPEQYEFLKNKFGAYADIYPYALGNENMETTFQNVKSNPTYSGLKQRQYIRKENIVEINVHVKKLDDVIQPDTSIQLIKIDVEGGEYDVVQGARRTIIKWRPYLIFEHGLGGADKYEVTPGDVYSFLVDELDYKICLMSGFLKDPNVPGFSREEFESQFSNKLNCYFLGIG
ncbi:MAG TPA: FkbM family methyltransferase [Saprospiraceae bacterium]|nr:FkbM family methyltransferase [Saprospiraceae bacterium]